MWLHRLWILVCGMSFGMNMFFLVGIYRLLKTLKEAERLDNN